MCHEHMLTQDPERLLEEEDLEEPSDGAGSDGDEASEPWQKSATSKEETLELTT